MLKGTRLLGSVELVHEKRLKPLVMKSIWLEKDALKVEYNDPHKHALKWCSFAFTLRTNTVGHFME